MGTSQLPEIMEGGGYRSSSKDTNTGKSAINENYMKLVLVVFKGSSRTAHHHQLAAAVKGSL